MNLRKIVELMLIVCFVSVVPVSATTYYVAIDGNDDANGLSWQTAFATIQKGIDTAANEDLIEVDEGTYVENITFNGKDVTIKGLGATINGNGALKTIDFGTDANANISGFTITGGTYGVYCANSSFSVINNCIIKNNDEAVVFEDGNGVIRNCTILNNADYGIRVVNGNAPSISNCILWNNNDDLSGCNATYSCIQDDDSGTGNIRNYPYFTDYAENNFHLTWNSSCINKGDPNGNYDGQTDIDGDNRVVDLRIDIGADEIFETAENLVKNPGFEMGGGGLTGTDPCTPLHWQNKWSSIEKLIDPCCTHSGSYSWKFTNDGTKYSGAYSTDINVDSNDAYEFSVWVKTEGNEPQLYIWWEEFDLNKVTLKKYYGIFSGIQKTTDWKQFIGRRATCSKNAKYVKMRFFGPYETTSAVWWDDFVVRKEIGTGYLPAYGCVNEPNVSESIKFGDNGFNENWIQGTITNYMSAPCTDGSDENITYRELKTGKTITIGFPAFDAGPNGLPNGPMLLEIIFKDTVANSSSIKVTSKIDWINCPDPCYLLDSNDRYVPLTSFGGFADSRWKYMQYGFQESDFQLLRAINGKYTIRIQNLTTTNNVPIDYVCLRKISDSEWQSLYERQRNLRFEKVELADKCEECDYDEPNLVIFCRDYMHPVYKDTRPAENEPVSIETFSAWGEVEPVSFSIYSEQGIDDLEISVSNLTCDTNENSVIEANKISIWRVVYDEARLGYLIANITKTDVEGSTSMKCALVPDRLEKFEGALSVGAGTTESIWLKINIPDENRGLSAGQYSGQIHIQKEGLDKTIDINLIVHDVTLETPNYLNIIYHDPFRITSLYMPYSGDINETFNAYTETKFDAYYAADKYAMKVYKDDNNNIFFDSNAFEMGLDRMMVLTKEKLNKISLHIQYSVLSDIYKYSTGKTFNTNSTTLWADLSDPCFCEAFGKAINRYCEIGQARGVKFLFLVQDEPGADPYKRILCDRLYTIVKDINYVEDVYSISTNVTYYTACDEELPSDGGTVKYVVPDGNIIPPLTNLVDYKIWNISYAQDGYSRHQDVDYHGYFGYYTTSVSRYRNPVYNRFLHGLFAYATDVCAVSCYAMGDYVGDPYNDFDSSWSDKYPFSYPDFLLAYPTWSGELHYTIGGLEAIREGIKDGRYIATLEKLIAEDPNNAIAQAAQGYLDDLKDRVDPNYSQAYQDQSTELGHYQAILQKISQSSDPNDYAVFTEIRKQIAEYIGLLD